MTVEFSQPCQVDLDDKGQVIQHFRDMILLSQLFDYSAEMLKFIRMLKDHGWGVEKINKFIELAGYGTAWEGLIDPPLPSVGDRREYEKNKHRWKK